MEGQDASLVRSTQWRDLLHLTSKFLADASGLIEAQLARQRILGPTRSDKKQEKAKTKRAKTGFQLFADFQHKEMKAKPEYASIHSSGLPLGESSKIIAARWKEVSPEEKERWRLLAVQGKDSDEVVKAEPHSPTPTPAKAKVSLSQAFEADSESSSEPPHKHGTFHTARDSSDTEEQPSDHSSSEERRARRKKHKHKHSSDTKKHDK